MPMPLSSETLVYGLRTAADPQVSPDGSRIVYTLATAERESGKMLRQLWLCGIDGRDARQITWSGTSNSGARWSPDGRQLAFVSDRAKGSGIYVVPVDGPAEAREITGHAQGISELAWSPDGARIAYLTDYDPANPDEEEAEPDAAPKVRVTGRIDYKADGRGYVGDRRPHVFVVDVASGERRRVTSEAIDHGGPRWSPDGRRLAMTGGNPYTSGQHLHVIDLESGTATTVGAGDGAIGVWAWPPAGERIIFSDDPGRSAQSDFYVWDLASSATRRLTDDLPMQPTAGHFAETSAGLFWLDERQVLFHGIADGASGLYTIDSEGGSVEPVVTWQALHGVASMDAARRYVAMPHNSFSSAGEVAVYDMQAGTTSIITGINAEVLSAHPPAGWERFEVGRDGFTVEGWLLTPPDFDPAKHYPLVLDIHGGPHGYYGHVANPAQQVLATDGMLVAICNPRGSSSYGRHFVTQVTRDWGGEDYLDLMAVVDMLCERPYVDASRLGVSGYSYGGYMTSWILGHTSRFKAAVCGAPVFDFESFRGTSDIGFGWGEQQFGGTPHEAREAYGAHSPSEFAHRATTPTLIIHGEADERCPIGQGEQLFVALLKAGVEAEFVRYPGEAHGFRNTGRPVNREDCFRRMHAWFRERLGGPEPG